MDRHSRRLLPALTFALTPTAALACPICVAEEGAAMARGGQAGAIVLIAVAAAVLAGIARFAFQLWRLETGTAADSRPTPDSRLPPSPRLRRTGPTPDSRLPTPDSVQ